MHCPGRTRFENMKNSSIQRVIFMYLVIIFKFTFLKNATLPHFIGQRHSEGY